MSLRCVECNFDGVLINKSDHPHCGICSQPFKLGKQHTCCVTCSKVKCECVDKQPSIKFASASKTKGGWKTQVCPWDISDVKIKPGSWDTLWKPRNNELDLAAIAANYYTLLSLTDGGANGVRIPVIAEEAAEALDVLCNQVAPAFMDYFDLAIGGELRHHAGIQAGSNGKTMTTHRKSQWANWYHIRQKYGVEALQTARDLFLEWPDHTAFGGKKWATGADILYKARTGQISKREWVHLALHLEHNGGCFFNKLTWCVVNKQGYDMSALKKIIFPAHGSNPPRWEHLLPVCGPSIRSLFMEYWPLSNKERMERGEHPTLLQSRPLKKKNLYTLTMVAEAKAAKKAALKAKMEEHLLKKKQAVLQSSYPKHCMCPKCMAVVAGEIKENPFDY